MEDIAPLAPLVSVVMPILDARGYLEKSLPPLSQLKAPRVEWIIVDDGSRDDGPEFARLLGATIVASGGRGRGPAHARNVGVGHARGSIIVFVDADVVVHCGAVEALVSALADDAPGAPVAVYGSYDDAPPVAGIASRYMNLRHHFYHRIPLEDSPSFWSGLGAVRREAFLAVGGFDTAKFARPSIEDVDLGHRLRRAGGRIRRDPTILGTHLKRWTLFDALRTDVLRRAWPWARLMALHPGEFADLNVSHGERARAILAAGLAATALAAITGLLTVWWPAGLMAAVLLANAELLGFFVKRGGLWFGLVALIWHQLYYLYSAVIFVTAKVVTRKASNDPAEDTLSS